MLRIGLIALTAMVGGPLGASTLQWEVQAEPPLTKDRVSRESMEELVRKPIATLRTAGMDAASKSFEQLVAVAVREHGESSIQKVDLLTAFGVMLYQESTERDDVSLKRASLTYLERAISAARDAFGDRHPEVALALNSYADVALQLGGEPLKSAAVKALEEAVAIRTEKLGANNVETIDAKNQLDALKHPQDSFDAAADALEAIADSLTTTDSPEFTQLTTSLEDKALWKPSSYYTPLIDDFVDDMKNIDAADGASKKALAGKYGLSVPALEEGIALLRGAEKKTLNNRGKAELRAASLAWLKHSNRAPIALTLASGLTDEVTDGGCKLADVESLMQGSRDNDADLWAIATGCGGSEIFAYALERADRARPALLYLASGWTRGDWAAELASTDMLLDRQYLGLVEPEQRPGIHAEIARSKLSKLLAAGLFDEAVRFADGLDPTILKMVLRPTGRGFRAAINGFSLKDDYLTPSPADDYAAALALTGRLADANRVLDGIATQSRRDEARTCLEQARSGCMTGSEKEPSWETLVVDQLLHRPNDDPYVLVETANIGFSNAGPGVVEALCRILTEPVESSDCELARRRIDSPSEPDSADAADRALWTAIAASGGKRFEAARTRYVEMRPKRPPVVTAREQRASIDPAPVPFKEMPMAGALAKPANNNSSDSASIAALPRGFTLVRREKQGQRAVAVSLSTRFDPNGEVSGGGYWVHFSDDGGKSWKQPLYTGLAEHFPYIVPAKSRLPMLAGDRLRLEVEEALIDTTSISYPPVAMGYRRRRSGIYLDIPIASLEKDSDGDGLTDIAAHHLLLDGPAGSPTPYVVGRHPDCSSPAADTTLARLEILKTLFQVEGRALIEAPDNRGPAGWRRTEPSGNPPIFLLGNPDDWRCVTLDRPMIVYSEADRERLRRFSPDFQLIDLPPIRWNRTHTRGFVTWNTGWAGGTYRLIRDGQGWKLESISEWIS